MMQEVMRPEIVQEPREGRGCLLGCLIAAVVALVVVIGGIVVLYYVVIHVLDAVTDTEPAPLPEVVFTEQQGEELTGRIEAFKQAMDKDEPLDMFVLSQDDINGLIQTDPEWEKAKGKAYVTLENDRISGQVSVPLGEFGEPLLSGRYLNAAVTLSVFMKNGELHVHIQEAQVKNKPLPEWIMKNLRTQNMAKDAMSDPESSEILRHLQGIEVRDGKLIIIPAPPAEPAAGSNEVIDLAQPGPPAEAPAEAPTTATP